ncbi:hypothetical protein GF376_02035, partial [Candidatus Peregrinibacteria bacterium]|nr:hypothetical protein [Candidatus Peregrinibacteria bacterium]
MTDFDCHDPYCDLPLGGILTEEDMDKERERVLSYQYKKKQDATHVPTGWSFEQEQEYYNAKIDQELEKVQRSLFPFDWIKKKIAKVLG